jgi:hypothetical protein
MSQANLGRVEIQERNAVNKLPRKRKIIFFFLPGAAVLIALAATDTYRENQATVMVDQANINQLEALEGFKILREKHGLIL